MAEGDLLLEVTDLVKHFPIKSGMVIDREVARVRAVDGVSFTLREGETLGLVGESGCGKSTLCRAILQLTTPTSGSVRFAGEELVGRSRRDLRAMRRQMQMIFQDPFASLNPRKRVGQIVGDPLALHGIARGAELKRRVQDLLDRVGLNAEHYNRFPHEFSGGQRQRIGIARALALRPKLIVADEPVSALDVSVQAQIINLLEDVQDEFGLSYLFVAHDLGVVRHVSDRIAVMYLGKIVENSGADELYDKPIHPYTNALLSAVPIPDPKRNSARERLVLEGDVPSPIDPPSGCRFHTRCPWCTDICTSDEPAPDRASTGTLGGLPSPPERLGARRRRVVSDRICCGKRVGHHHIGVGGAAVGDDMRNPAWQEHRLARRVRNRHAVACGLHEDGALGDHRLFGPGMGVPAATRAGLQRQALDVERRLFAVGDDGDRGCRRALGQIGALHVALCRGGRRGTGQDARRRDRCRRGRDDVAALHHSPILGRERSSR